MSLVYDSHIKGCQKMCAIERDFVIGVREVHTQPYRVRAKSKDEAIDIVREGGGEIIEGALEYSHTLDPDYWTVEKES